MLEFLRPQEKLIAVFGRAELVRTLDGKIEWNVRDSDATVIFTIREVLTGGSKQTAELAVKHRKPWIHLSKAASDDPGKMLLEFLAAHQVKVLNVAGPRASKEPDVAAFVQEVLNQVLSRHD
jgi:hypothetical protein